MLNNTFFKLWAYNNLRLLCRCSQVNRVVGLSELKTAKQLSFMFIQYILSFRGC